MSLKKLNKFLIKENNSNNASGGVLIIRKSRGKQSRSHFHSHIATIRARNGVIMLKLLFSESESTISSQPRTEMAFVSRWRE